jgi:hypothetical protein
MSDIEIPKYRGRYKGTCRACNSVGELNVMLSAKVAEQAAEIANLKTLAQAVVARHRRKIIIGDLSSYEMESEELENLAKALEVVR